MVKSFTVFFFCWFFIGCSSRQIRKINDDRVGSNEKVSWKEVTDSLAQPLIDTKENMGIVVGLLTKDKKIEIYPYGVGSKETQWPIKKDTIFCIGSVTKTMVVSLLLILEEKGFLSIEDKIASYLPDHDKFKDKEVLNITLAQLASHTSGLPREPRDVKTLSLVIAYFFNANNFYSHMDEKYVYDYLQNLDSSSLSSEGQYSNIGVGLLGHIISKKMNRSLASLMKEYIFTPLEMSDTTMNPDEVPKKRLSLGYSADQPFFYRRNTLLKNWRFTPMMIGTGGVYSTAPDLIKYLKAHIGISKTSLDKTLVKAREMMGRDGDDSLALGWYVEHSEQYSRDLYFYHGMVAGFNTYIGFDPKQQVGVVVLRNNFNWTDVIGANLLLRLGL